MTQLSKRNLRERKAPKMFDSDNEDQDPWGYGKHSYSKEQKNPSQQLNSDARLLVKFLTSINKSYKELDAENRKKETESIREPVPLRQRKPRTIESQNDLQKRQKEAIADLRLEASKKVKEAYHLKAQNNTGDKTPRTDVALNKFKTMNNESAHKMLTIESNINKSNQLSADQNKIKLEKIQAATKELSHINNFKKTNPLNYVKNEQKLNGFPFQTQNSFFTLTKQKEQKVNELVSTLNIQKPVMSENKLFKRSAYHVAIAYHIYLNKLRAKGSFTNEIDPTYYARRLKQTMHRRSY